jgi:hypothetical protein
MEIIFLSVMLAGLLVVLSIDAVQKRREFLSRGK